MSSKRKNKNKQNVTTKSDQQVEIPTGRNISQVSIKTLIPPSEPSEPTDSDIDQNIIEEEAKLQRMMKELKAKIAEVAKRKKQVIGGAKLERMRRFATETTDWAVKAASKAEVSISRANKAVDKLSGYENKLGVPSKECIGDILTKRLEGLTEAAEIINAAFK